VTPNFIFVPSPRGNQRIASRRRAPNWFRNCVSITLDALTPYPPVPYLRFALHHGEWHYPIGSIYAIQATEKIWHNGKWINWDDAKLHVLSHVVSYGSSVFERHPLL